MRFRLRALALILATTIFAATALASPSTDPPGDAVKKNCGECSNFGQDIASIDAIRSGNDVVFTVGFYTPISDGSPAGDYATRYYGPQVELFTNGSTETDHAILPRDWGANNQQMTLVSQTGFGSPCSAGASPISANEIVSADFKTVTYTLHLADLGGPSSLQYKVVMPGVVDCNPEPDGEATDIAPDTGRVAVDLSTGVATPTPTPTASPTATATPPAPLTPAQTLPNLSGVPASQLLGATVGGTLNLAGPADSVTVDVLAAGAKAAAAKAGVIGHLVKTSVPKGPLTFKVSLNKAALKKLKKARAAKVTLRVTTVVAGKSGTLSKTIKLKRRKR